MLICHICPTGRCPGFESVADIDECLSCTCSRGHHEAGQMSTMANNSSQISIDSRTDMITPVVQQTPPAAVAQQATLLSTSLSSTDMNRGSFALKKR